MTNVNLVMAAAEHVMKWKRAVGRTWVTGDGNVKYLGPTTAQCFGGPEWDPLADDSDCMTIVDKLDRQGWRFELTKGGSDWYAIFFRMEGQVRKPAFRCDDRDRRRAIVIAALRAVGVDV